MSGWTNRGKYLALGVYFRGVTAPTTFYMALVTSAAAPGADTNTLSELTQIATGGGYSSGGIAVARNSTDFDTYTEDDAADAAYVRIKDLVYSASGASIPSSGSGARYAVLTDDNGTVGSRQIVGYFDLGSDRTVSDGQDLTLQDCEFKLTE